jgi:site-specific DNA-methyltransferase (adenine-specific)
VLRVLKPGGYLLAFGGTRTQHRMICAIEDAGFEVRDVIAWVYGCLDEKTEVATAKGVMPYHKTLIGDLVLCYDPSSSEYSYQPILEIIEYEYNDTAYRLIGDFGEQIVSRNHRCIIERDGVEVFCRAEEAAREHEARVPILESLPELREALSNMDTRTVGPQQSVLASLRDSSDRRAARQAPNRTTQGSSDIVRDLWRGDMEAGCVASQGHDPDMFLQVQRRVARFGMGDPCSQGPSQLDEGKRGCARGPDDGHHQSSMEGWPYIPKPEGEIRGSVDQVCPVSSDVPGYGAEGWLRDGASAGGGEGRRTVVDQDRDGASQGPRCDQEFLAEPDAVRDQCRTQGIRAWRGHHSAVVRIVPFHHTGKVWCLRVPTGAFVAVRGGVAFPTGNSGFPKSLDISKAIDRAAGAEREVVGIKPGHEGFANRGNMSSVQSFKGTMGGEGGFARPWMDDPEKVEAYHQQTAPATDAAKQWNGWGTALKPSMEIIAVARRPLSERTVAANVLKHSTGGINIDATRIPLGATDPLQAGIAGRDGHGMDTAGTEGAWGFKAVDRAAGLGRWPANLVHDGSPEVEAAFAAFGNAPGQQRYVGPEHGEKLSKGIYGDFGEHRPHEPRGDAGTASRFFYSSKADASDRAGSLHPTIKPIDLMRWLVRMVTPPGGTVLDCFAGSGSTGEAAMLEGFNAVLIEREAEYAADIKHRMKRWGGGDLPLFADPIPEDPDLARQVDLWREPESGA